MNRERTLNVVAWSLVGLLTVAHLAYYFPRVVDDLFISLRYAENLAHGRGLVYNVGERVEGTSSPAWAFLQAIGLFLRVEGVTWTKLLALSSLGLLHVSLHLLGREHYGLRAPLSFVPNVALALNSHAIYWGVLGLETPGFLACLIALPVTLRRATAVDATGGQRALAIANAVLLAAMRPEAPVWTAVIFACELAAVAELSRASIVDHVKRLARVALPAAAIVFALLLLRRVYYDDWVPNTYYVKGADNHFELGKLRALVGNGAPRLEAWFDVGGVVLLVLAGFRRSRLAAPAIALAVLAFTAAVELDWMPDLRHLLPVLVLAPLGWAWAASSLGAALGGRLDLALTVVVGAFTLAEGVAVAKIDARNVLGPFGDRQWIRPKTMAKWHDALLAYRRVEPPHVTAMSDFDMGMITQNYRLLEASAAPLDNSWYVGRDIGKVGYYTEAKIWDTAGLFTLPVVDDPLWREKRKVSDALIEKAMRVHPVAAQLFDDTGSGDFSSALGRNKSLENGYQIVVGWPDRPIDLVAKTDRPTPEQILARYEASLAKFPKLFHLQTLYGETVGAAMAKRTRIVRQIVSDLHAMTAPPPDAPGAGTSIDDGAIEARGCTLVSATLKPGDTGVLHCFFDVVRADRKPWTIFVHFVDEQDHLIFGADHLPASGLQPSWGWRAGMHLHDVVRFVVPTNTAPGTYGMRLGFYWGPVRADTKGPKRTPDGRMLGPDLQVVP